MKLAISNIGWKEEHDRYVYGRMKECGFSGLEIAPTRILQSNPYDRIVEIDAWNAAISAEYGFRIPSMQSIWFGRSEKVFGTDDERQFLLDYTQKAILFAEKIGCKNMVFGCPRNRTIPEDTDDCVAVEFFKKIGDFAYEHHTAIGMEANPPIYNTNYINDTRAALELIRQVDSKGFLLNLDVGTMIYNEESVGLLEGNERLINHVHISEPNLAPIQERNLHKELAQLLRNANYHGYVSIEMGKREDISIIESTMDYVACTFG